MAVPPNHSFVRTTRCLQSANEDAVPKVTVDVSDRDAYDRALHDFYHAHYHDEKAVPSRRAAERILPIVFSILDVGSMIDVGCGPGAWLDVARQLGVPTLTGVEGAWAAKWFERDGGPRFELVLANLEDELRVPRTYDLATCLEVVEHLSPARGGSFVADLCRCAPHVLFGAAIPGQEGPNHLNTQWPSMWAACFAAHRYRPLDVVRPRVWGDADLKVHYRQNPVLFVRDDCYDRAAERALAMAPPSLVALDQVHPYLFTKRSDALRAAREPRLRRRIRLALGIPTAAVRQLSERWRRRRDGHP
jgi:SAM-dependent methyltransferase